MIESSRAFAWYVEYADTNSELQAAARRRIVASLRHVREWGFAGTLLGCLVLYIRVGTGSADVASMLPGIGLAITSSLAAIFVKYAYEKLLKAEDGDY